MTPRGSDSCALSLEQECEGRLLDRYLPGFFWAVGGGGFNKQEHRKVEGCDKTVFGEIVWDRGWK